MQKIKGESPANVTRARLLVFCMYCVYVREVSRSQNYFLFTKLVFNYLQETMQLCWRVKFKVEIQAIKGQPVLLCT